MRVVFLAFLFTVAVARSQDSSSMAVQQATQQNQSDMMATGQATLAGMQQFQFNQVVLQQMQLAGIDTDKYSLTIPEWSAWKVASWSHLDISVKPGTVKPGTQVRIRWRGGDYAAVYYTLDGWSPTLTSTRYTGPITINGPVHLRAIGIGWNCLDICTDWKRSETVDVHYEVTPGTSFAGNEAFATNGVLHSGTLLKLKTTTTVRSDSARPGDKVGMLLDENVMDGNRVAISKGAVVDALLTQVEAPAGKDRPGMLVLAVRSLHDSGNLIQLQGSETMEGGVGKKGEEAIIEPGMSLQARTVADVNLRP